MKMTWRRTNIPELVSANINTRESRTSQITLYRSNIKDPKRVDDLTELASHSLKCQNRNYNFNNTAKEMYEAKKALSSLRKLSLENKITNWKM